MERYTDVESQVKYGLDKIDSNRKIEVSLKDFLFMHNVIGEFIRFFHQPTHYETLEDVHKFLGNNDNGALHLLCEVFYKKFQYRDVFPEDIKQMVDDSEFQNPNYPYYYKS
jgi:hypothetical protein